MKKLLSILTLLVLLVSGKAVAGTSLSVDMNVEIPPILDLTWWVNGASVQLTGANAITVAELNAGYKNAINGGIISASSNDFFDITVEASNDLFIGGSDKKSTRDLFVDLDGAGTYSHQLNGTNAITLLDEQAPATNELHSINYRLLLFSSDTPGIYSTDLTYTIVVD